METQVLRYLVGGSNFEELMKRGMSESAGTHYPFHFPDTFPRLFAAGLFVLARPSQVRFMRCRSEGIYQHDLSMTQQLTRD